MKFFLNLPGANEFKKVMKIRENIINQSLVCPQSEVGGSGAYGAAH